VPLLDWLQLSLTSGIGPILISRIIDAAGGAAAACQADVALLVSVEGIGTARACKIRQSLRQARAEAEKELERAAAMGLGLICPDDPLYPLLLRSIPDPPAVLYMRGTLEPRDLQAMAIVGSRRCSHYGREQAERFGALLAGVGMTVVSGGARGVDSAAHRGALSHSQGRTVAVLGCGLDVIYPPENGPLFDQISGRGAVLTEYALGTPPTPENFPRRNRIVSGMSRGVLVVEADVRSGALITARQALDDHNRPVFAVPGRVDNAMSAGPHQLIRDGAVLAAGLDDILQGLGPMPTEAMEPLSPVQESPSSDRSTRPIEPPPLFSSAAEQPIGNLTGSQEQILQAMGRETAGVDRLIEATGIPAHVVLQELTFLTLKGMVKRIDGQTFVRAKRRA